MNDTDTKELLERLKRLDDARVPTMGIGEPLHKSEEEFLSALIQAYPTLLSLASRTEAAERELAAARERYEAACQTISRNGGAGYS